MDRRQNHKRAYRFIMEQGRKLNCDLSYKSDKAIANVNFISLKDIVELKEGIPDLSQELVVALKRLFSHVATEAEIDDYLVRPFLPMK